jgi:hypothetical protein
MQFGEGVRVAPVDRELAAGPPSWVSPEGQRHDRLAEALELVEELEP